MEFNSTLLIQLGIYLGLIFILKILFFDPILKLLNKREALTEGKKEEASGMREKITAIRIKFDSKMSEVKQSLEGQRQIELKMVKERAEQKLSEAKSKVERKLIDHQIEMEAELKRLRGQLPQLSSEISNEITKAILGAKVVRS
ncbi:MAG: hypothetical protein J0L93_00255 [Deltaproteobacteria bacterium]|nr:hypothetical protein [Deltaproteobacteria bacterium]